MTLFKRFRTALDVPRSYYKSKLLVGKVVSVADGDTIRVWHTPTIPYLLNPLLLFYDFLRFKLRSTNTQGKNTNKPSNTTKKISNSSGAIGNGSTVRGKDKKKLVLSENTISIRLYGIDAPEMAHFGKAQQPFARESKQYLSDMLLTNSRNTNTNSGTGTGMQTIGLSAFSRPSWFNDGKTVRFLPLKKDFYDRLVCLAYIRKPSTLFLKKHDISLELVRAGMAEIYSGKDVEFYSTKHKVALLTAQKIAKKRRLGIWSIDIKSYTSPLDFKKANRT
ncbi:putative endonuclease LCL3 [Zancudomyces culisetae]|uniref:Putative endonuclease LCL3 n=1 Tax=Zancudomyces culisetae TaxID=1213189 RepID=A0A1R1PHC5_ZANCU|nr:putative endonuclease LCL3 [Zancudomyces culisetae]|eukprot:OMH80313.1 putative endonuclease LCL3 [Zancudomyces culisetae]